jgi:Protein of unknown function (DUF3320)
MEPIDLAQAPDWAVTYAPYSTAAPYTYYELGSVEAREPLRAYLTGLLRQEAPIHEELVNKRIRAAFKVGRVGPAIRDNIEFVARHLRVDGRQVKVDTAGFYRIDGLPTTSVRVPADAEDVRPVKLVPADEIDLAVVKTVTDLVSADEVDILTTIRRIFGWRRSAGEIAAAVYTAIESCLKAGSLERSSSDAVRLRVQDR